MLYGVIDIGSNTIRLMIYRVDNGAIHPVLNNKFAAGLAGYITAKGKMSKEGIRKAVEVLTELRTVTEQITLDGVFPFGTAALRNITNTQEVLDAIRAESGFAVRVLSGEEEAEFDYYGALQSTPLDGGLLVDVGGGTTGISVLKDGKVIFTGDEPTGGTHMTLVLAGFHGWNTQEAELAKRDPAQEANVFPVIKPVVEKMASIVRNYLREYPVEAVYVVGGACCFTQFESVFEKFLGVPVVKPAAPLLVTPLGIAVNCKL